MKRIYNKLTEDSEIIKQHFVEVANLEYHYGEQDNKDTPPTGMVAELSTEKDVIYHKLSELYHDLCPVSDQYNQIDRAYVNAFAPRELP